MSRVRTPARVVAALAFALGIVVSSINAQAAGYPTKRAPDFTLLDQRGKPFTLSHVVGRPVVLFFGYAHCPDVCPTMLATIERARESVTTARDSVVALITVDPRRDNPAELGRFVGAFNPAFIGLTGSSAQLDRVYRAYHVKVRTIIGDAAGYLVAHTAFVYYIDRNGRLAGFGTWDDPQAVVEEDLGKIASSSSTR